jgi:dTDP-4-amino-4,6-dideoxygalactose transaminase
MRVPLLDLQAQHAAIRAELDAAIARVIDGGRFVGGPQIGEFEEAWAGYCEAHHAVGCSSGTDAITLTLRAAGIGPGDEVITTALTFVATVEAIVETGATPIILDVDPDTALLAADRAASAIGPRTAALLPVHLYGQPVDLGAYRELADRHGLFLLEDAAQAHGARWDGTRAGSVGDAAAFSFFPGKNLGALGDAGAITTNDAQLADRLRRLRDHGRLDKYRHQTLGVNSRLDSMQAAVLTVKLRHLEGWNDARRGHAAAYDAAFASSAVEPIFTDANVVHACHQYVVRTEDRDTAVRRLADHGIATGVHYPIGLHRQPATADLVDPESCPIADRLAATVLSLPVFPELTIGDRGLVAEELRSHAADAIATVASDG